MSVCPTEKPGVDSSILSLGTIILNTNPPPGFVANRLICVKWLLWCTVCRLTNFAPPAQIEGTLLRLRV